MKGILLAGGAGSRLHPVTLAVSKQLLPVYNKPLVYYPLSTLMLAGIRDVLIISTPHDLPLFRRLLGDGKRLGARFEYAEQAKPRGIAEALLIAADFLDGGRAVLALGDNVLYGNDLVHLLKWGAQVDRGARVFAYHVADPQRYGVVSFDTTGRATALEEKPVEPKSSYAVPGIYFYDATAVERARQLKPGKRGELEITDLNRAYLAENQLHVEKLGRGIAWFDTGTHTSLLEASNFIAAVEGRQGLSLACLEEIAWRNGWIGDQDVLDAAAALGQSSYASYLKQVLREPL